MGPAALVVAWCASLAPLLLERAGVLDFAPSGADATPRLGLCALAWIALAGMPRPSAAALDLRAWWGTAMASLPVLATAGALDVRSGASLPRVVQVGLWALLFVALTNLAAELARRRTRVRLAHATFTLGVFLGVPMFVAAFGFGARASDLRAPAFAQCVADASPWLWSLRCADAATAPYAAALAVVVLCALTAHFGRGVEA